ncbi:MAG: hypothetical protein LQ345_000546 [Seirophora villosa]|nr:MAG: hypothetical protein LQ345_000546 [Seirophora villosa]
MPPRGRPRRQVQHRTEPNEESTEGPLRPSGRRSLPPDIEGEESANKDTDMPEIEREEVLDATSIAESTSTEKPGDFRPPRQPVERLASLRGPGRFVESRAPKSAEPEVRKLKVQPKSAIRRSKEEREALERAEADRLQARLGAGGAAGDAAAGRVTGRGSYTGISNRWQSERYSGAGASGFLGGATPEEDKRQREALARRSRGGGRSSLLSGSSRATAETEGNARVKKESGTRQGSTRDGDGDIVMGGSVSGTRKSARVKNEPEASTRVGSDDELFGSEHMGKRINIEEINLIDSEESSEEISSAADKGKGKAMSKTPKAPGGSSTKPVFIKREQHKERTVGVNTEPASVASAALRRRAEARGKAPGEISLAEIADLPEDIVRISKKKAKSREVEFIKDERKWQGVYQDDEDEDQPVKIKEEPKGPEDAMLIDDSHPPGTAMTQDILTQGLPSAADDDDNSPRQSDADPNLLPKPKPRRTRALTKHKPVLQTEEDAQEWRRYKRDKALIHHVLRPIPDQQTALPRVDNDGDTEVTETKALPPAKDQKEGTVYLIQLPPVMPDIEDPQQRKMRLKSQDGKPNPEDQSAPSAPDTAANTARNTAKSTRAQGSKSDNTAPKASKATTTTDPKIKHETSHSATSTTANTTSQRPHALPPQPQPPPFPHGRIGTLTLDAEGFPSATWSDNFRLDVGRASDYAALQEVVLLKSERMEMPRSERGRRRAAAVAAAVKKEDAGEAEVKDEGTRCGEEAWAVGQLGGGFVMVPDWGWMFGG